MKSLVIKSKFQEDCRRNNLKRTEKFYNDYDDLSEKLEIVLEQDLKYRYSCIIDKLGLLENQDKLDAELDSKD